jgi:DNA-binding transcriptional LysR family regulator
MDKLKQLESFVSVATKGSLTAAARAEGVAPAIMGRRLDALEERLGVKLLVRTTRRISLTHEGSAFLEDCQRLLADLGNAEASVSAGGVKASGHLRITAPAGFGRRHVAPLVPRFRELHADVTISLNLSDRVVDLGGEGFDCAVRVGDFPDSSLVSVRLADNRRMCVAAPGYLKRHGTPEHPERPAQVRLPHAVQRRLADARLGFPAAAGRRRRRGWCTSSRPGRSIAPTARCCTTGACKATALPGAAPGRWSRRLPTAACAKCWRLTPRRPTASTPCSRSASTCPAGAAVDRLPQTPLRPAAVLAAGAVLVTGLARVFLGSKGAAFYAHNPLLYLKLGMFLVIGLISIKPTLMFVRWRRTLRASGALPDAGEVKKARAAGDGAGAHPALHSAGGGVSGTGLWLGPVNTRGKGEPQNWPAGLRADVFPTSRCTRTPYGNKSVLCRRRDIQTGSAVAWRGYRTAGLGTLPA